MTQPYPIEFLYSPGKVVIAVEAYMQLRHVFTDGRPHPKDPDPLFKGHSIGHWEGDTLVVDTVGFVPWSMHLPGHRPQRPDAHRGADPPQRAGHHRRSSRPSPIPRCWRSPGRWSHSYKLVKDDLREYECEQNNHDSADEEGRPGFKETK